MLVLTRHVGQEIIIGDEIRVVLLEMHGEQARLGIDAPRSIRVDRREVQMRRLAGRNNFHEQEAEVCATH